VNTKPLLHSYLLELVKDRIIEASTAVSSAQESRNSDTKSSAGDKYETGRAMMQMEIDRCMLQLNKAIQLEKELGVIINDEIRNGSLVITNHGNFFLSVSLGQIEVDNFSCYAISLDSPLANVLLHHKVGDAVMFQNKQYVILSIE